MAEHREAFARAWALVVAFYAFNSYLAVTGAARYLAAPAVMVDPLWPVVWAQALFDSNASQVVAGANVLTALVALLAPHRRWGRVAAFVGLLQYGALVSSFGKINHSLHMAIWSAFFLMWLPAGISGSTSAGRRVRQRTLQVVWTVGFALLLFYSMSGVLKLAGAAWQAWRGEVTAFAPSALALQVAGRLVQTHGTSAFGDFIVTHPWFGSPGYLAALYIETFAVFVAFRPAASRIWGVALIALHLGIGLAMGIWFSEHIVVVALFVVRSPFPLRRPTLREQLLALPFVDLLYRVRPSS